MASRGRPKYTYRITVKEHYCVPRETLGDLLAVAQAFNISLAYARLLTSRSGAEPITRRIPMSDGDGDIFITVRRVNHGE